MLRIAMSAGPTAPRRCTSTIGSSTTTSITSTATQCRASRAALTIHYGGGAFFYHGGEWYRRDGGVSVVIAAPIGAYVPVLPPLYSTVWWSGVPYYYANDTYY